MDTQGYRSNLKVNLNNLKSYYLLGKKVKLYKIVTFYETQEGLKIS